MCVPVAASHRRRAETITKVIILQLKNKIKMQRSLGKKGLWESSC